MDLSTMMTKIDLHKYETVQQFMSDIELICRNALEYNPDRDPQGMLLGITICRDVFSLLKSVLYVHFLIANTLRCIQTSMQRFLVSGCLNFA